jgi:hypothetical protein
MTTDDPTQPHPIIPERIMTTAELATLLTAGLRLEGFDPELAAMLAGRLVDRLGITT